MIKKVSNMTKSNGNTIGVIISLFVFSVIIIGVINTNKAHKRIKQNHDVVCGEILSVKPNRSGGLMIYRFYYGNETLKTTASCLSKTKEEFELGRNRIFVAVLKGDIFENVILETEKDFAKFNISNQDTAGIHCDYEP